MGEIKSVDPIVEGEACIFLTQMAFNFFPLSFTENYLGGCEALDELEYVVFIALCTLEFTGADISILNTVRD